MLKKYYEPEINGLRGLAVLLVLFFHYQIIFFESGFVGVDIFFVISGYLITKIILRENLNFKKNFFKSFGNFLFRRFIRIFPALTFLIGFVIIFFSVIFSSELLINLSHSVLSNLFLIPNIYFWELSYFDESTYFRPLLHTWSLGVEYHFYFFVSLLIIFFVKYDINKHLINTILITTIILSLILINKIQDYGPIFENSLLYGKQVKDTIFYLSPFRFYEFLFGSFLAFNNFKISSNLIKEILQLIGFTLIILGLIFIKQDDYYPNYNSLFVLIGTSLIIIGKNTYFFNNLINNKLINFFGNISFSLYLYHWPIYVFFKYLVFRELFIFEKIFCFILSIFISSFSYYKIEKPFIKREFIISAKKIILSSSFFFIFFVTVFFSKGLESIKNHSNIYAKNPLNQYGGICNDNNFDDFNNFNICKHGDELEPDFLLLGDSHAGHYYYGLKNFALKYNYNFILYAHLCNSYPNYAYDYDHSKCKVDLNIPNILITSKAWYDYQMSDENLDNKAKKIIIKTISITQNKKFKHVDTIVVIGQVPGFHSSLGLADVKSCYDRPNYLIKVNCNISKFDMKKYNYKKLNSIKKLNFSLEKYSEILSSEKLKIYFIDPFKILCSNDDYCYQIIKDNFIYSDLSHLSKFGSNYFISKINDELMGIIKR